MKYRVNGQIFDHSRRDWILMPLDIEAATGDEAADKYRIEVRELAQHGRLAIKGIEPAPTSDEPLNQGNREGAGAILQAPRRTGRPPRGA